MRSAILLAAILLPRSAAAQAGPIAATPSAVIHATSPDGDVVIERIVDADLLPGGGVVVADGPANTLLFFDTTGKLVRRAGGTGDGPGEFRRLWGVEVCGGGVIGYELSAPTLTRYSASGQYRDTRQLDTPFVAMTPVRCVTAGAVVGVTNLRPRADGSPGDILTPMDGRLRVIDSSGTGRMDIVARPVIEMLRMGGGGVPRPLGARLSYAALGPDLLIGTGEDSTVRLIRRGEQTIVALPLRRQTIRTADRTVEQERWAELVPPSRREAVMELFRSDPGPQAAPFYREMLSAPGGQVWLLTSPPADPRPTWTITDGRRLLGAVTLPVDGSLLAIGSDRTLILVTDDDGEQRLQIHRIAR